jgi:hypothetical protein
MADEEPDAAGGAESLGAGATVGVAVAGLTVTAAFFLAVRLMLRYMHLQATLTREEREDQLAAESRARHGPGVSVGSAADEARASADVAGRAVAEAAAAAAVAAAEAAAAQERARSAESKVIAARAAADRAAAAEREDAAKAHRRASAPELFPHTPPR